MVERQTIGVQCSGAAENSAYCLADCPVGQYADEASSQCRSCDVIGCLDCPSCEPACPIGQYAGVDKHCVQCDDSHCAHCFVGGQYCYSCTHQSDLLEMGRCVSSCSAGLYPNTHRNCLPFCPEGEYPDGGGQCQPCTAPCQQCVSPDICVTCQPGYYLLTNQRSCVTSCGRGLDQYPSSPSQEANVRLVGGLVRLDGSVQLFARGNVGPLNILHRFIHTPKTRPIKFDEKQ